MTIATTTPKEELVAGEQLRLERTIVVLQQHCPNHQHPGATAAAKENIPDFIDSTIAYEVSA